MTPTISVPTRLPIRTAARRRFATLPIALISATLATILTWASAHYGYFGDELYFLAAADHLAWGYADQQPALPALAGTMQALFPDSPLGLRLPAILVTTAGVPLTALIVRELDGDRRAQVLAAAAFAISPQVLINGRLLGTMTFDPILWTAIIWLLVRWVRRFEQGRADDNLLLWAGIATAVTLQVKFLVVGLWAAMAIALLWVGPRAMLGRPKLWIGAGVALLTTIPTLIWQALNGWPQLGMHQVINSESHYAGVDLLRRWLLLAGIVGAVLVCYGFARSLLDPRARAFRFVGVAACVLALVFLFTGAREYYMVGLYPVLLAIGAVGLQHGRATDSKRFMSALAWPIYGVSAVVCLSTLTTDPFLSKLPGELANRTGDQWSAVTRDVSEALESLPGGQQGHTVVVVSDYWTASALHHFGPEHGIERVYSGSRGYGYFGHPPESSTATLYVGSTERSLREYFDTVHRIASFGPGESSGAGRPIWLAEDRKRPWHELWPDLRGMGMWH